MIAEGADEIGERVDYCAAPLCQSARILLCLYLFGSEEPVFAEVSIQIFIAFELESLVLAKA
jgi:hypothetical protein